MFDTMRRHLKNYLIPHEGNNNRPHLLRETGALVLALVIIAVFGFSVFRGLIVNRGGEYTAAVLPVVLVTLTNEDRADSGLEELSVNPVLEEAARLKAEHMAENSYFAHVSPDGIDPWYWFYRVGYNFVEAGENLAVNFVDSEDVSQAWMDSPLHRANIMNGDFTEIGIAAVEGKYKGKKTIFVVQMFGKPAQLATVVPSVTVASQAISAEPVESEEGVAGAVVVTEPIPESVVSTENDTPNEYLIKDETTARVEGAVVPADSTYSAEQNERPSLWESFTAHPRAIVSWSYLVIGLLIAFVVLLMVYMQVHRTHSRSIMYGTLLLALIALLSYFNWLLLSADLVIT